jgi:hypothetical protein
VKYADPLAQAEIDRLRACSDPTLPAEGERYTAQQMWHVLLEASSHRRLYVLNQFLEAQDDANRCFLMNHEARLKVAEWHRQLDGVCVVCGSAWPCAIWVDDREAFDRGEA